MLRITGISMIIFSLILAGLHDMYEPLKIKIIGITYIAFFIIGFILFCLSSSMSNSVKSSKLKTYLFKFEELFVCFSVSLASVVVIFVGYVFFSHRLGTSIALLIIGICSLLLSIIKSILIFKTKIYQPVKGETGNLNIENGKDETTTNKFVQNEGFTASDHWDRAIVAAENGQRDEALREFGVAIAMNPKRYISEIHPSSNSSNAIWNDAVQIFTQKKDESDVVAQSTENQCHSCKKDIGKNWHYGFEDISWAELVGLVCPDCGLILCEEHSIEDGKELTFCPNCKEQLVSMREGPASSSIVEKLRRERRYHGVIKDPSVQGRPIED